MKSPGQFRYETDCLKRPRYHDGTPRKRWHQLGYVERQSWEGETRDERAERERLMVANYVAEGLGEV